MRFHTLIRLVTINYPPEIGGAPHLIHDLALRLKARGHDVCVLTGYPCYNLSAPPEQYRRGLLMTESVDGVLVQRIRIPSLPRASRVARGIQHFIFGLWLSARAAFLPRPDVTMVFSPPLPLPWSMCLLGALRRTPVVVNVQDLFPREAVELGMLTNRMLIRIFETMERHVYRLAAAVTVHSPGTRQHVVDRGGATAGVEVVYNWVDTGRIMPGVRNNDFARRHALGERFVVSYAGTMGWAQDMMTIVDAARRLVDCPQILFLLVGDGVEKENAQAAASRLGLRNLLWLPMQPFSVYPQILAASDISLINLSPELKTPVVPSKLLSIMAAGRPVVASLPPGGDARAVIVDAGCGICVNAGDGASLARAIATLAADAALAEEMGRRGRAYVEAHFDHEVCADQIEALLVKVARSAKRPGISQPAARHSKEGR